jgi:hypothetical protein
MAILTFAMRITPRLPTIRDVPSWSLVIGVALLSLMPGKWPWHLGALVGLAALAITVETADMAMSHSSGVRFRVVAVGFLLGVMWAWLGRVPWNAYDLVELDWSQMPLAAAPSWVWMLVFAAVVAAIRQRTKSHGFPSPTLATPAYLTLVAIAAVVSTSSMLIADAVLTDGWTFARQNPQTIAGRSTCSLADPSTVSFDTTTVRLAALASIASEAADEFASRAGYLAGDAFVRGRYFASDRSDDLAEQLGPGTFGSWTPTSGSPSDDFRGSFQSAWHGMPCLRTWMSSASS